MIILIKNGRVIDPCNKKDEITDILIENSKIKEISKNIRFRNDEDILIVNAINKIVTPGLIDVHVHFREPGFEYKETIKTGSRAAAIGGFTTVICEPNTKPPVDTEEKVTQVLEIAKRDSIVNVKTKACISREMAGIELVDIDKVKEAGAVAISDDGQPIEDIKFMDNALKKAKGKLLVNPHCEESKLSQQRFFYTFAEETNFIRRDLKLNNKIKCPLHISHVSFKDAVEEIEKAKNDNQPVTAEATPHHFTLSKEAEKEYGNNAKVNPPLRSEKDVQAIREGLQKGIIEVIATDHAPHSPEEKARDWDNAPFGIIGLETSLGVVMTKLVHGKILSMYDAIAKMTCNPARIFGIDCGRLSVGSSADITIIDPFKEWTVDVNKFASKGRNCPFNGWQLKGKAFMTIVGGQIVMEDGVIIENYSDYLTEHLAHDSGPEQAMIRTEQAINSWPAAVSEL